MKSYCFIVALCACLVVGATGDVLPSQPEQVVAERSATQVIKVDFDDITVEMPVFEDKQFSPVRRNFDNKAIREIVAYVVNMAKGAIIDKKNSYVLAATSGTGMLGMLGKLYLKYLMLKRGPEDVMDPNYTKSMSGFLTKMIETKSDVVLTDQECFQLIKTFCESYVPVVEKSPVGMYLNWPAGKVNGMPLNEYIAPVFKWYRDNGYSGMINMVKKVSKWLKPKQF